MKTKIPILIAVGLFFTTITYAQYGSLCRDHRVTIQAHLGFPIPVPVINHYDYYPVDRERYDNHRDWRAEQYDRYCHESRGYRMSREEFYRSRCDSRVNSYYAPRTIVEYRR